MNIIREGLDVPKSEIEIELDRKRAEEEEKLRNLEITMAKETEKDKYLKAMIEKRDRYFPLFLQKLVLMSNIQWINYLLKFQRQAIHLIPL
jgi:hypothetical protein